MGAGARGRETGVFVDMHVRHVDIVVQQNDTKFCQCVQTTRRRGREKERRERERKRKGLYMYQYS